MTHGLLFWIFASAFVVLSILTLLAIFGRIKGDAAYRTFATATFASGILALAFLFVK